MQMHNDVEGVPLHEYSEQSGYMGSPHYSEQPSGQPFQQQTYYTPMPDYGPVPSGQRYYGQPQFVGTSQLSDIRFSAVLSYAFGWLTGLLFLLFGGRNRFVRFHALQSLAFFGAINVIDVGLFSIVRVMWHFSPFLVFCGLLMFMMLNFIAFVTWIMAMVQAARGVYFRLPFVGELVARCFDVNAARPRW